MDHRARDERSSARVHRRCHPRLICDAETKSLRLGTFCVYTDWDLFARGRMLHGALPVFRFALARRVFLPKSTASPTTAKCIHSNRVVNAVFSGDIRSIDCSAVRRGFNSYQYWFWHLSRWQSTKPHDANGLDGWSDGNNRFLVHVKQ